MDTSSTPGGPAQALATRPHNLQWSAPWAHHTSLQPRVAGGDSRWWHNSQLGLNKVLTVFYVDSLGGPRLS